jgi:GNAT superfamily N-acetyltransferase
MIVRPAGPGDVPAMAAITTAAEVARAEVAPAASSPSPVADTPRIVDAGQHAYLSHLVARGRVAVAEVEGVVVGFGAAVATGRAQHLADLFVLPARQGTGIGRRLLEAVMGDAMPRTTFGSDDPRAVPLYIRAGMRALWPNLYLAGDPARLPAPDAGLAEVDAGLAEVAALERRWVGVDRTPDLPYWSSLAGARAFVARRDGAVVGVAFARDRLSGPGRWLDHAIVAPGEDGPATLLALLRRGLAGGPLGGACVPGPSPLVRVLLEAGFKIRDRDTFLASDPSLVDPEREIMNTGFL